MIKDSDPRISIDSSPAQVGRRRWFDRFTLRRKIVASFVSALVLASLGPLVGVLGASYWYRETLTLERSLKDQADQAESLQKNLLAVQRNQSQLLNQILEQQQDIQQQDIQQQGIQQNLRRAANQTETEPVARLSLMSHLYSNLRLSHEELRSQLEHLALPPDAATITARSRSLAVVVHDHQDRVQAYLALLSPLPSTLPPTLPPILPGTGLASGPSGGSGRSSVNAKTNGKANAKANTTINIKTNDTNPNIQTNDTNNNADRVWLTLIDRLKQLQSESVIKGLDDLSDHLDVFRLGLAVQEQTLRDEKSSIQKFQLGLVIVCVLLSLACALALVRMLSRQIAQPLETVIRETRAIAETGAFDQRVTVAGPGDVGQLTRVVNHLLDELQAAIVEREAEHHDSLLQNEKLADLGRLMAGVAHEINNPLNFSLGNLKHAHEYAGVLMAAIDLYAQAMPLPPEELQKDLEDLDLEFVQEDLRKLLNSMQLGLDRVRAIVFSLKDFTRLDQPEPQSVDLHNCLESTLTILGSKLKEGIVVDRHYGDLPTMMGYPGALYQVFTNLIGNAIEAVQNIGASGCCTTTTSPDQPDPTSQPEPTQPRRPRIEITTEYLENDWIRVAITDNGCGMDAETQAKMFETFYTTKPRGVGTGLGLAIAQEIVVKKHGGKIECNSIIGRGTTFWIHLPIAPPGWVPPSPPASSSQRANLATSTT